MKVNFELRDKVGFFIQPETDFEAELISCVFQLKSGVDGYVKCGLSPADVEGLRVYSAWCDCTSSAKEENKSNTQQLKAKIRDLANDLCKFSQGLNQEDDTKLVIHVETELRELSAV